MLQNKSKENLKKNLDSLNLPTNIEGLFPEKVQMYEKIRGMEQSLNEFMHQQLVSYKEDLLASGGQQAKLKRQMDILLQVNHGNKEDKIWKIKIEGKVALNMDERELFNDENVNYRFLSFFDKIQIQFPGHEHLVQYKSIDWIKAKNAQGSKFDCIEIEREYADENLLDEGKPV